MITELLFKHRNSQVNIENNYMIIDKFNGRSIFTYIENFDDFVIKAHSIYNLLMNLHRRY